MKFGSRSQPQLKRGLKVFAREGISSGCQMLIFRLPGTPHERGALHPLTQMLDRSIAVFRRMGIRARRRPRRRDRNGIALMPSILPPIIRRGTSRTHFICRMSACYARTHPRCKSSRWNQRRHPFASSPRARLTGAMRSTPLITTQFHQDRRSLRG